MMLWGLAALAVLSFADCSPAPAPVATSSAPAAPSQRPGSIRVDTVRYGRFGPLVLYRQREHPSQVVLFVSGDGGWNRGVVGMAEELATMDALVVGIDIRRYLSALAAARGTCSYPAADFEALSQWLQQTLGFPLVRHSRAGGTFLGSDTGLRHPGSVASQHLPRCNQPRILPRPPCDQTVLQRRRARLQSRCLRTGVEIRAGGQRAGTVGRARG